MRAWLLKYKKFLLVPIVLLAVLGVFWQIFASKVEQALQDNLMHKMNQQLNGRLQVEAIDLSLLGWIKLRDVSLLDEKGALVAQSPAINIRYQLSNLTSGNLDLSRIETVAIDRAEVWLEEANGVNNWDGLLRDNKEPTVFRGKIQMTQGKFHAKTPVVSQILESVNGFVDFQSYPNLAIDTKGQIAQSSFTLQGNWEKNRPFQLTLGTDEFNLLNLSSFLGPSATLRLEGGSLKNSQLIVKNDENNKLHYQGQGEFSGLNIEGVVSVREGKGKFSGNEQSLEFQDLSLFIAGQQAQGQGKIFLENDLGAVDFTLSLPDVDPVALTTAIVAQRPLALQIHIDGPLAEPVVSGSFTLPHMTVSDMSVSTVTGKFRHTTGRLALQQVQGKAHSGNLFIAGDLLIDSGRYELDVSGQGMNSSQLTDKDVQGPLDFTGHVTGQGDTAVTRGDFIIHGGKAYGLSFQTLTGQFIKRGTATDISDIAINTSLGTFYPEKLSREALEQMEHRQLPTSREALKKVVTDKVLERLLR